MKFSIPGNFLNSNYVDENGRVIYKVNTTIKVPGNKTSISKILPGDIPRSENGADGQSGDRFAHLARIDWKPVNSVFYFGGEEIETEKLFVRREGWLRRKLTFIWEDGKQYQWISGFRSSDLVLDGESETPVATFHAKNVGGIFGEKRHADLEIFPAGESIVDMILVTFIYTEKIRSN
ncbi:hypothetical protein PM082_009947 [Marasmius tenuissimus]|nr:hypothetical protein PM082_009947 [Marasmius tenuissimus]